MDTTRTDFLVIGAGIAGSSAAAELAAHGAVTLLEMERQPGYHATGRSAAFFAAAYGNEVVRKVTAAGEAFIRNPPSSFSEVPLLRPRDCYYVGGDSQYQQIEIMQRDIPSLSKASPDAVREAVPIFNADYPSHAVLDTAGGDLDVDALQQGYLRQFRQRGGQLVTSCSVNALSRGPEGWRVTAEDRVFTAPVVVNAAGAWADDIARRAGLMAIGITPKRRSACLVDPPAEMDISDWPLIIDADEEFYFKPDAGALLISPADETPSDPCDAQPEELDIAIAVDRVMQVTSLNVRRINHRWAGLRSFAPDKTFVVGFDPRADGFFWLAGQGGYGVQSAPGLAKLCAHLLAGAELAGSYAAIKELIGAMDPQRLL